MTLIKYMALREQNKNDASLTVFVLSSGESTYEKCISALKSQTIDVKIDVIKNISPMDRAFQQMLDRCETKYFVQVDADMILYPNAIETMITRFKEEKFVPEISTEVASSKIAMLYFPLLDVHLERQIIGVKVYNHHIVKNYPYTSDFSCEVTQLDRLKADGYHAIYQEPVLGLHGTEWTAKQIFERYKRLFQKKNIFGSGNSNYDWLIPYPKKFFSDYQRNRNATDFWAYQGAITGLAQIKKEADGEQNNNENDPVFRSLISLNIGQHISIDENRPLYPKCPSFGQYIFNEKDITRLAPAKSRPLRICMVTTELPQFGPQGGIATAFKLLSETLVADHSVYILFVTDRPEEDFREAQLNYFSKNIKVYVLSVSHNKNTPWNLVASSRVKYWLASRNFDIVHFSEYRALGFYSLLAKKQGYLFQSTNFCLQAHGPSAQLISFNNDGDTPIEAQLTNEFCEKRCLEMADYVVSPSRYLLDWFIKNEFHLPDNIYTIKNIPHENDFVKESAESDEIKEIVFFGKQIELKGLRLFCDAIDELSLESDFKITFLGRSGRVDHQDSLGYIAQRAIHWNTEVSFKLDVTPNSAMSYCSNASRLIIIPSLMENSPYVVMECMAVKAKFLASDVGGISELIYEEDRNDVLFDPSPIALSSKILNVIENGVRSPRPSYTTAAIKSQWKAFHALIGKQQEVVKSGISSIENTYACTVCITHRDRPHMLTQCIESILSQNGIDAQIIIVDDGSADENLTALSSVQRNYSTENIKWIFQKNKGLASARNRAALESLGNFIFFIDDDDLLLPGSCKTMLNVMHTTAADIVIGSYKSGTYDQQVGKTVYSKNFEGPDYLGLGSAPTAVMLKNMIGPAFCVVNRRVFEALGGYQECQKGAYEDWAFYQHAILSGARLEFISEPLFIYTEHSSQMTRKIDHRQSLQRLVSVYEQHSIITPPLEWAIRRMNMTATGKDRSETWARIDVTTGAEIIKKINLPITSQDEKINGIANYFKIYDQEVEINSKDELEVNAPIKRRRMESRDRKISFGLLMMAEELSSGPPGAAIQFINEKHNDVDFLSDTWKKMLHWRAKNHIRANFPERALIDIFDANIEADSFDSISALSVYFYKVGNIEKHYLYDLQLRDMEETQYLMAYPDVKAAVFNSEIDSGKDHYLLFGKNENRTWPRSTIWFDMVEEIRLASTSLDS